MNFDDLEGIDDPYPLYARWRNERPIWWADDVQGWVLSRHSDVRAVLKDPTNFSSAVTAGRSESTVSLPLLHDDPPRHTSLRAIVNRSFTSRVMKGIEADLAAVVDQLLEEINPNQAVDIADALTIPLPVALISHFMGIPFDRRHDFKRWSDSLTATGTAKTMEERMPDIAEMMAFFRDEIPKRRSAPGDDLISKVVAAEVEGELLTEETIVGYCQLLLIAGNETTTNLLSNLLHYMADHQELWDALRADPAKIDAAVEECLRYDAPVHWISRTALSDTEFHGQKVANGEAVYTVLGSANRDPDHYEDPDSFRLDRGRSDHHTFGHGIHFCIGAPLARMEAKHALQGLLKKFATVSHARDAQNERTHSSMLRGYHHLWMQFTS